MAVSEQQRFFFVHVMKTAGATVRESMTANFDPDSRYPDWQIDPPDAYFDIDRLLGLPAERQSRISLYVGHFPYVVSQLVGDVVTMTLLRDPIERTLSLLKQRSREYEVGQGLEEIYDGLIDEYDGLRFKRLAGNHQTKIFAMTESDRLRNYMDPIELDSERFEIAKRNLSRVDVIGFQEDLAPFYRELSDRFGFAFGKVEDRHVSPPIEVSASFRDRLAADVALDFEFYEFARRLVASRGPVSSSEGESSAHSPRATLRR
jgi:hypothetical protein